MSITKEEIASVKGRGFLRNRGTDCFSGRVVSVGGLFRAEDLTAIAACAKNFGTGEVIFTSRLSAEIVGIPFEKIPEAEAFLGEAGLSFGGTGAKVRPITACKGTTCVFGNLDTRAIASTLHERFYIGMRKVVLPHKFKIGVGGCPNSCMKPSLNDVGIEGCRAVHFDASLCRGCARCAVIESCPSRAVSMQGKTASVDDAKCTRCGVCVGKCPFGAAAREAEPVARVFVGGTWGKTQRMGTPLSNLYIADEVPSIVEKVMLWYKENGYKGERLGKTIDRLGIDVLEAAIAGDDLLSRREEIIAKPLKEKE